MNVVEVHSPDSMMVTWLILLIVTGALMAGVVLAAVLLGNRHTRGLAKGVGLFVLCAVVLMGGWLWMAAPQSVPVHTSHGRSVMDTEAEHLRRHSEAQAEHFNQLAENYEQHYERTGDEGVYQAAAEYRQQADEISATAAAGPGSVHVSSRSRASFGMLVLPLGLVFLVVVGMLFKHCGPGVGMTALALPLVFLFVGYGSLSRQSSYEVSSQARYQDDAELIRSLAQRDEIAMEHSDPTHQVAVATVANEEVVAEQEAVEPSAGEVNTASEESTTDDDPIAGPPAPADEMPDWVRQPPKSVENVYRRVVESSWYHRSEVKGRVGSTVQEVVRQYIQELASEESRGRAHVPSLERLGVTPRYIRERIVADEYYETRDFENLENSSGIVNLHQLLEFDAAVTDDLRARWRDYARQENVRGVAVLMGGILASLAGVLGLVKLDTYTKGYYTKRLFIGVPAAIIGIVLLTMLA